MRLMKFLCGLLSPLCNCETPRPETKASPAATDMPPKTTERPQGTAYSSGEPPEIPTPS